MTDNSTDDGQVIEHTSKSLGNSHEGHIDRGTKRYQLPKGNTRDVSSFFG